MRFLKLLMSLALAFSLSPLSSATLAFADEEATEVATSELGFTEATPETEATNEAISNDSDEAISESTQKTAEQAEPSSEEATSKEAIATASLEDEGVTVQSDVAFTSTNTALIGIVTGIPNPQFYFQVKSTGSVGTELQALVINTPTSVGPTAITTPGESWSYAWYECDWPSTNLSDYTLVSTTNNYTPTEAEDGKYLVVKIDDGCGNTLYGTAKKARQTTLTLANMRCITSQTTTSSASFKNLSITPANPKDGDVLTAYTGSGLNYCRFTWTANDGTGEKVIKSGYGANANTLTYSSDYDDCVVKVYIDNGTAGTISLEVSRESEPEIVIGGVNLQGTAKVAQTLTAKAWYGDSKEKNYFTEGVKYEWYYSNSEPENYTTGWTKITSATTTGATSTFKITSNLEDKYIFVKATYNAVTVNSYWNGPIKPQYPRLDTVFLSTSGESTSNVDYLSDSVIKANAKDTGGTTISSSSLKYQWQVSDDGESFENISGKTSYTLTLDESYVGKFVQCKISSDEGATWKVAGPTNAIQATPEQVSVSMYIIGKNKDGKSEIWGQIENVTVDYAYSAADLFVDLLDSQNISSDYDPHTAYGFYLKSITSPYDSTNTLGLQNLAGGKYAYWALYYNGKYSNVGISSIKLKDGDVVKWIYDDGSGAGNADVIPYPGASRPDWEAEWSGYNYANSSVSNSSTTASTPKETTSESWTFDAVTELGSGWANCSEPVIVNNYVYLAANSKLFKINKSSGDVEATGDLACSISYTSRPVYVNGVVVVPLDGGQVQALTASELKTVWLTDAISATTQSSSTISIDGNNVIVSTTEVNGSFPNLRYENGTITCINTDNGDIIWKTENAAEGYYWDGAAVSGDYLVISTSTGTVQSIKKSTGDVVSSVSLSTTINSDCVLSGDTIYLMDRDGKMHTLAIATDGTLTEKTTVNLGLSGCTATPVIVGGKLYVGGELASGSALVIYDIKTGSFSAITSADGAALTSGGVRGAVLVSTQGSDTYVYFTVNNASGYNSETQKYTSGGGVYRYKVGDAEATLIYDAAGHNNYCDSPVICDAQGNLYYINDSGTLFCLKGDSSNNYDSNNANNGNANSNSSSNYFLQMLGVTQPQSSASEEEEEATGVALDTSSSPLASAASRAAEIEAGKVMDWLPLVGIIAGVILIGGACWWLLAGKRRSEDEKVA